MGSALDPARLPVPRADGDREALRTLLCAREELVTTATGQINRLKALLRDGDDRDRTLARARFTDADLNTLARRRQPVDATRAQAVRHGEVRRLTVALREARRELKANHAALQAIVDDLAPALTDQLGVGPVSAAQVIVSFSHPGRYRNEAAFAALGGVSPIEASSGQTTRHRLNRGGDRALNRALHTIAMSRMSRCPTTRAYVERRRAHGKNTAEIRRCLIGTPRRPRLAHHDRRRTTSRGGSGRTLGGGSVVQRGWLNPERQHFPLSGVSASERGRRAERDR